jgi:hypothetical protein
MLEHVRACKQMKMELICKMSLTCALSLWQLDQDPRALIYV